MPNSYNSNDITDEVRRISPNEQTTAFVATRMDGTIYLRGLQSSLARILVGDPDSLYGFMSLNARVVRDSASKLKQELTELKALIPVAQLYRHSYNKDAFDEVISSLESMKEGSYQWRKNQLTKLKHKVSTLIQVTAQANSGGVTKDYDEVLKRVSVLVGRCDKRLKLLTSMHTGFRGSKVSYLESGLFQAAIEEQVDRSIERLESLRDDGPGSVGRMMLASATTIGLLDERTTVRDVDAPKYDGTITIQPGTPAQMTGSVSAPFWQSSLVPPMSTTIVVDGVTGTFVIPEAPACELVAVPNSWKTDATYGSSDIYPWPDPAADQYFHILVNNTEYHAKCLAVNQMADVNDLQQSIQSALSGSGVICSVVSVGAQDALRFSISSVSGSSSRMAFYNTSTAQSVNERFGLTFTKHGESRGIDSQVNQYTTAGFTAAQEPLVTSDRKVVFPKTSLTPTLVGGKSVFTIGVNHTAIKDDVVLVAGADVPTYYRVDSVDAAAGTVTLTTEILSKFSGSAIIPASSVQWKVTVFREYVTLTSPTSAYGVTSLTATPTSSSGVGLPTAGTYPTGIHNSFSLDTSTSLGSPIRAGDIITDGVPPYKTLARVGARSKSVIQASLVGIDTLSTTTIRILGKGTVDYQVIRPKLYDVTSDLSAMKDFSEVIRTINVAMDAGINRSLAYDDIQAIIDITDSIISVYGDFNPPVTQSVRSYARILRESRLTVIENLLATLSFKEIRELTPESLSELGTTTALLRSVSNSLGGDDDSMILVDSEDKMYAGFGEVPSQVDGGLTHTS